MEIFEATGKMPKFFPPRVMPPKPPPEPLYESPFPPAQLYEPPPPQVKRSISQARLEANRRNAQKSRGPRTAKGKARARTNALKHGLFAKVLPRSENPLLVDKSEYEQLTEQLREDFQPQTQLEVTLIESLSFDVMRLRHIHALEANIWDDGRPPSDEERRARDGIDLHLDKRTEEDCRADRALLGRMLDAVTDSRDEPFTGEEAAHLVEVLKGGFDSENTSIMWAQRFVQSAEERLKAEQDESKQAPLKANLNEAQQHLAGALASETANGAAAHGCEKAETFDLFVRRSSQIPQELQQLWRDTLRNWCLGLDKQLRDAACLQRRLTSIRRQRLQDLLQRTPPAGANGPVRDHGPAKHRPHDPPVAHGAA